MKTTLIYRYEILPIYSFFFLLNFVPSYCMNLMTCLLISLIELDTLSPFFLLINILLKETLQI